MATHRLDPSNLERREDWEGNNAAFACPVCDKVFIVSGLIHHGRRPCPDCGQSVGYCEGGKIAGGQARIEWPDGEGAGPEANLRLMAALKLFEVGRISSGKASEIAGLSKAEFLEVCGRYAVSAFNIPPADLEAELRSDIDAIGTGTS